jgi:hypothetical protein
MLQDYAYSVSGAVSPFQLLIELAILPIAKLDPDSRERLRPNHPGRWRCEAAMKFLKDNPDNRVVVVLGGPDASEVCPGQIYADYLREQLLGDDLPSSAIKVVQGPGATAVDLIEFAKYWEEISQYVRRLYWISGKRYYQRANQLVGRILDTDMTLLDSNEIESCRFANVLKEGIKTALMRTMPMLVVSRLERLVVRRRRGELEKFLSTS